MFKSLGYPLLWGSALGGPLEPLFIFGSRTKMCWAVCVSRKSDLVGMSNPATPRGSLTSSKWLVSVWGKSASWDHHERARPAARCRGPRTSCFQNDLRLFQAEVAKGYMTNSALTSLSPWVGSDRLPCILPKGRRVGCQTLWFSIRNILHFTIFCFGLKIISILSFSIKFSHVPS